MKLFFRILPWMLLTVLLGLIAIGRFSFFVTPKETRITHSTVLEKVEVLGKLELVKYRFKEITEMKEVSTKYGIPNFFQVQWASDRGGVLIAAGEAVGCIDLTKIDLNSIYISADSVVLRLPPPELCYYKVDLANTEIYDLELGRRWSDDYTFIGNMYETAEGQIKAAALESGILEQARKNAELILLPLLQELTGKKVYLVDDLNPHMLDTPVILEDNL